MNVMKYLTVSAALLMSVLGGPVLAEQTPQPYVRLAELEIDPVQMESFKAAVTEEVEASVRVEPGVLALYVVFEKIESEPRQSLRNLHRYGGVQDASRNPAFRKISHGNSKSRPFQKTS